MTVPDPSPGHQKRALLLAYVASVVVHCLILFFPQHAPEVVDHPAARIEATLAPRPPVPTAIPPQQPSAAKPAPARPREKPRVLAMESPQGRREAAPPPPPEPAPPEAEDMKQFLRELDQQAKAGPSLAQRSLAMARGYARQQARQDEERSELMERVPDGPPIDPFGLEMYLDALVKKLNRSAAFVRNDPRRKGVRPASVLVRLNPDGSLRSFQILNAGDQQDEIAYIKSVVDQAVPFSAFPADLRRSLRSLGMMICIVPSNSLGAGFGFTRTPDGRHC